ncbi:MAG: hypothetical protein JRD94_16395 [Deltaproteobacteria bacterium]|nr:hypothetical protein [Deltaproteobacteria bacterium]
MALLLMGQDGGCGGTADGGGTGDDIRSFIARVTTSDETTTATFNSGSPPSASGGPTVSSAGGEIVITGGAAQVTITAAGEFSTIYVSIEGVDGYWSITVPNGTLSALLLLLAEDIPGDAFDVLYQVAVDSGAVSDAHVVPTEVIDVGTGLVQVSVSWDTPTDVDLHVVDPAGEEVSYRNRWSASGGELDLDSNAGCGLDNVNNENITWTDSAPTGEYTARVNYYSACDVPGTTSYVVTVRSGDQPPETFTGTFEADDASHWAEFDARTVTTFTF